MHTSIFQFCTVTFEPCSEFHIMMDQFRIPMQHLKLYKMEAILKALWNIFMLVIKAFYWQLWIIMYSGGYTWTLNWLLLLKTYHLGGQPESPFTSKASNVIS